MVSLPPSTLPAPRLTVPLIVLEAKPVNIPLPVTAQVVTVGVELGSTIPLPMVNIVPVPMTTLLPLFMYTLLITALVPETVTVPTPGAPCNSRPCTPWCR